MPHAARIAREVHSLRKIVCAADAGAQILKCSLVYLRRLVYEYDVIFTALVICYPTGFLSGSSSRFHEVQHIFSPSIGYGASWGDYIFSLPMRCGWCTSGTPSPLISIAFTHIRNILSQTYPTAIFRAIRFVWVNAVYRHHIAFPLPRLRVFIPTPIRPLTELRVIVPLIAELNALAAIMLVKLVVAVIAALPNPYPDVV